MKIIAGNFKSNLTRTQTAAYLSELDSRLEADLAALGGASNGAFGGGRETVIFPAISSLLPNRYEHLELGAQNCHAAQNGAFTGEISLCHLEELRIRTILLGHSERRGMFGESDALIAEKFAFFAERGFRIFYCVGESSGVKNSGKTREFLRAQIASIDTKYENLIIAYEPIWAIGSGLNASNAHISEHIDFLRGESGGRAVLYGGSVNEKNAPEILPLCDGVLVGGASLDVAKFHQIIKGE